MRPQDPFEALLHRYRGMLFTLCRRYSRHGMDVDDLLQEATVALWKARDRVPEGPRQPAWIWRMVNNTLIDVLRSHRPTETLPEGTDIAEDDRSLLHELHELIAKLDEPDRTIVSRQLEGYSYEEIAAQTGLTVKNVSVRLVRVKEKLRNEFI